MASPITCPADRCCTLAETTADTTEPPEPVRGWLTNHSWRQDSVLGWICGDHHH